MRHTKVVDLMTRNPVFVSPDTTLYEAAGKMRDINCGVLPVGRDDTLKGVITDRDIVIRAIAKGKDPKTEKVRDHMTTKNFSCHEDDTLEKAADEMYRHQVGRLLVKDKTDKVTGILSFGSILRKETDTKEISNVVKHAVNKRVA